MLEHKSLPVAELKATGPASGGGFEAVVAVFGNVDKGGDRMLPGFFEQTLKAPPEGRGFPPIVWTHLWGVVPIGASQKAEEVQGYKTAAGATVDGLFIAGDLFVDEHQTAKEVYVAMSRKGGDGLPVLRDFSFGYSPTKFTVKSDDGFTAVEDGHLRDLIEGDLFEVGPTLVGMNPEAGLVDVKSLGGLDRLLAELKRGARNSASDKEMLQEIHDLTTELGIDCGEKSLLRGDRPVEGAVFKALGAKAWGDVDSYAIYLLTHMIEGGAQFVIGEDDPADVARMRKLLLELAAMLADELAEVEPDSAEALLETVEEAMLPTSGASFKDAAALNDLLLTFPRADAFTKT